MTANNRPNPGAQPGNTNAQAGDNPATSTVIFRCTPAEKAGYVRAAQAENLKLTEWIKSRLF